MSRIKISRISFSTPSRRERLDRMYILEFAGSRSFLLYSDLVTGAGDLPLKCKRRIGEHGSYYDNYSLDKGCITISA